MAGFILTRTVEAPCAEVFRVFTDFARLPERIPDIKKVEMLTDGPVGVGSRFRETRVLFKKEATEVMEVTAFEADRLITLGCDSCGCHYEMTHRFTPQGDGTRVEFEVKTEARSFFARLMKPLAALMMGAMKRCIEKDIDALKSAVEAGRRVPMPG